MKDFIFLFRQPSFDYSRHEKPNVRIGTLDLLRGFDAKNGPAKEVFSHLASGKAGECKVLLCSAGCGTSGILNDPD